MNRESRRTGPALLLCLSVLTAVNLGSKRLNAQAVSKADQVAALTERVKALESQVAALSEKANETRLDSEYIAKTQQQYEAYYEKAFNSQQNTVWAIGIFVTLILAVVGRVGFQVFDRQIEYTVRGVVGELRSSFEQRLAAEAAGLKEQGAKELLQATNTLNEKYNEVLLDLREEVKLDSKFELGMIYGALQQYDDSIETYRGWLRSYLKIRDKGVVSLEDGGWAIANLLIALRRKSPEEFEANAAEELKNDLYKQLRRECAMAVANRPYLAPVLDLLPGVTSEGQRVG